MRNILIFLMIALNCGCATRVVYVTETGDGFKVEGHASRDWLARHEIIFNHKGHEEIVEVKDIHQIDYYRGFDKESGSEVVDVYGKIIKEIGDPIYYKIILTNIRKDGLQQPSLFNGTYRAIIEN